MKCSTCGQKIEHMKTMDSFYLLMTKRFTRLEDIAGVMHEKYGITYKQLRMRRRTYSLAQQRRIFCKLAKEFSEASFPTIGNFINKDHTTVLRSIDAELDADYTKIYQDLRGLIAEREAEIDSVKTA
jgi:chromosomal replication initiation ATPase DnaA